MSKSKYLNETGLSQLVTLMQEDTDNRIELALENVVHAGNNPEDSGEILLVNADTLDGHTADYFATAESVDELRAEVESGSGNQVPEGVTYVDGTESEDAELLLVDADTLGGNAADYYASKTYVAEQVADANHLTREIVTEIPTVDTAKDNVIYMYKVESATGNDVYQEYQLINGEVVMVGDTSVDLSGYVKNETVENIVNGTTVVAEATKSTFDGEGNKISETYVTQENMDKMHSLSSGQMTEVGWYRIAKYVATTEAMLNGQLGNSCDLVLKCLYGLTPSVYNIHLESTYQSQRLSVNSSATSQYQLLSKIRYTVDITNSVAYLEVYSGYVNTAFSVELTHVVDQQNLKWQAITPTLTEETVDGVTVTTTYDIPANAKPVTTVDDTNLTGWTELTEGFDLNNAFGKYRTALDTITATLLNLPVAWTSGELTVEWIPFVNTNTYGVQKLTHKYSTNGAVYYRVKHNDTWGGWEELATTADLANYLPKTGGYVDGYLWARANSEVPLGAENTNPNGTEVRIRCALNGAIMGYFGFKEANKPLLWDKNGYTTDILHTGNKPSGSYTGTGTGNEKVINTGGIGSAILIESVKGAMWISLKGGHGHLSDGTAKTLAYDKAYFAEGQLVLNTSDNLVNESGVLYEYQVL